MGQETPVRTLSRRQLFLTFLKAGLAFGGGLGILAALEEELVHKQQVVSREDFLANYALGRMVPSGTMTAMAVAYGYRFGGLPGTVVAITGLVLPALVLTVLLTAAYAFLPNGPWLVVLSMTILPAALAFIVKAALKLGRDVFRPSFDLVIAAAAFAAVLLCNAHPSLVLLAGGLAGLLAFRGGAEHS